ncbi:MAG: DUF433 domain-containing protein [Dehalococcoidia bacterium]|jgi:uncharacterized protein (DUF433 family)
MTELQSLIEATEGVAGGRPCLAGTGMPVVQIAVHYRAGETPRRILRRYPHLDLQRIHAAIAFYLANREAMDAEIEADAREFETAKREQKSLARSS